MKLLKGEKERDAKTERESSPQTEVRLALEERIGREKEREVRCT